MGEFPLILSIAAISGGGKTTVAKRLAAHLNDGVKIVHYDDYQLIGPSDFGNWAVSSGDYNDWDVSPIVKDINLHIKNREVKYIILDYPFSYLHAQLKDLISISIFIDTPLDIAMARRLIRENYTTVGTIKIDSQIYLDRGRKAYQIMIEKVKPSADIVIDGALSVEAITQKLVNIIRSKSLNER
ncbi:uridine kinase [Niallia taxi]|uniref:uridine kinase n=1 Tax=Niallia taxi TaxID=2499688 RepID=UPI0015F3F76E|nr:uridine kinase [Niallia taxi]MCM3213311.1 uridine kinase [Niallia taxi]MDK8640528.1 uridine kinase [Niallia taxi]